MLFSTRLLRMGPASVKLHEHARLISQPFWFDWPVNRFFQDRVLAPRRSWENGFVMLLPIWVNNIFSSSMVYQQAVSSSLARGSRGCIFASNPLPTLFSLAPHLSLASSLSLRSFSSRCKSVSPVLRGPSCDVPISVTYLGLLLRCRG